ncbi:MAG: quinone-dependent dihydroorotate dehydrogenase [Alphaproteobacteria bacterium]|mgnify:CR=1 FL=1
MTGWYDAAGRGLRLLPPEAAHRLAVRALAAGFVPLPKRRDFALLKTRLWGHDFMSPIGLAAGFDKDAEAIDGLLAMGFDFVEAGTVTPLPQAGNPKPRLFRLTEDQALINRLGFNSGGLEAFKGRLTGKQRKAIVGVNIGVNKESADPIADYVAGLEALHDHAAYIVINVSSPNTPGLREFQARDALSALVETLMERRSRLTAEDRRPLPLLIKIAPDLDEDGIADIAVVALQQAVDGLIISNTTTARPKDLESLHGDESGGLSGAPLFDRSTALLAAMFQVTEGRIPLIGVGGVASGADAYAKIKAGASLVQLYTALIYEGPGLIDRIKADLAEALAGDGYTHLADAVGADNG